MNTRLPKVREASKLRSSAVGVLVVFVVRWIRTDSLVVVDVGILVVVVAVVGVVVGVVFAVLGVVATSWRPVE
jgi:hypothetical protein